MPVPVISPVLTLELLAQHKTTGGLEKMESKALGGVRGAVPQRERHWGLRCCSQKNNDEVYLKY